MDGIGFFGHDGRDKGGKIFFPGFGPGLIEDLGIGHQFFDLICKGRFFTAAEFIIRTDGAEFFGLGIFFDQITGVGGGLHIGIGNHLEDIRGEFINGHAPRYWRFPLSS